MKRLNAVIELGAITIIKIFTVKEKFKGSVVTKIALIRTFAVLVHPGNASIVYYYCYCW